MLIVKKFGGTSVGDKQRMYNFANRCIEEYKKGYNVKYVGKVRVNAVNTDYIKLSPTKNNGIKEVNLFVNTAKNQLVKLEQFSTDNSVSVIAISDYRENQNLSNSMFSFDKAQYKNYIVTEL